MKTKFSIFFLFLLIPSFIFSQNIDAKKHSTERPSIALVLAGGGARGFAHIPILQLFDDLEIPIDMIVGNSAGALVAGYYAAGYKPKEIALRLSNLNWEEVFQDSPLPPYESYLGNHSREVSPLAVGIGDNFSLDIGKGLINGQKIYQIFKSDLIKIPSYLDFDTLPIPYRAIATDLTSGQQVILKKGDLAEAMRASMSIPTVFEPFQDEHNYLIDGMATNNIPVEVPRKLGYNYVIVVDITTPLEEDPTQFDGNPVKAFTQMFNMQQSDKRDEQNQFADIIITPDLREYTTLDYLKAKEIIARGELCAKKIRPQLEEFKERILPSQKDATDESKDKKITLSTETERTLFSTEKKIKEEKSSVYSQLDFITVSQLETDGIMRSEIAEIEEYFNSEIKAEPLNKYTINRFIDQIYKTGNYQFIKARINTTAEEPVLEIIATPTKQNSTLLLMGVNYESTLSKDSSSTLALSMNYQIRGLSGRGSALSLRATGINGFCAEGLYVQPLGKIAYIGGEFGLDIDQNIFARSFLDTKIMGQRKEKIFAGLFFGLKFNNYHLLFMDANLKRLFASDTLSNQESPNKYSSTIDFSLAYTFSNLNRVTFPTKGFYVNVKAQEILPIAGTAYPKSSWIDPVPFIMLCSVDFTAALQFSPKTSLIVTTLFITNPTQTMNTVPDVLPEYGLSLVDRRFMPHHQEKTNFGNHKAAMSLSLQIQPNKQITLLGGQWFFSMTGAVCSVWNEYAEIIEKQDLIEWIAHIGFGLRIKETFGARLRGGIGSYKSEVTPFLSIDFGSMTY